MLHKALVGSAKHSVFIQDELTKGATKHSCAVLNILSGGAFEQGLFRVQRMLSELHERARQGAEVDGNILSERFAARVGGAV